MKTKREKLVVINIGHGDCCMMVKPAQVEEIKRLCAAEGRKCEVVCDEDGKKVIERALAFNNAT